MMDGEAARGRDALKSVDVANRIAPESSRTLTAYRGMNNALFIRTILCLVPLLLRFVTSSSRYFPTCRIAETTFRYRRSPVKRLLTMPSSQKTMI